MSRTATTALLSAEVNDMHVVTRRQTSPNIGNDVDLVSEDSLTRLQGNLGIDSMSTKIDYLSEIVE